MGLTGKLVFPDGHYFKVDIPCITLHSFHTFTSTPTSYWGFISTLCEIWGRMTHTIQEICHAMGISRARQRSTEAGRLTTSFLYTHTPTTFHGGREVNDILPIYTNRPTTFNGGRAVNDILPYIHIPAHNVNWTKCMPAILS